MRGAPGTAGSLADRAVGELADDVEVAEVPGVLLEHVEQDPAERRRLLQGGAPAAHPGPIAEPSGRRHLARAPALVAEPGHQQVERLVVLHSPPALRIAAGVAPGVLHGL